jgi:hypothetical protein
VTDKKDHGNMDRFVWTAEDVSVHHKNKDPLPSSKDPQSKKAPKAPKGGAK